MEQQYYILSLKWSPDTADNAVWWRPAACGYTSDLGQAGLFTQSDLTADPGYYNNGTTTQAWRKETAEHHAHRVANYRALKIASDAGTPERDEAPTHDVSARWDGGLHNRPHDEHSCP
jgi:hypothetical protein